MLLNSLMDVLTNCSGEMLSKKRNFIHNWMVMIRKSQSKEVTQKIFVVDLETVSKFWAIHLKDFQYLTMFRKQRQVSGSLSSKIFFLNLLQDPVKFSFSSP